MDAAEIKAEAALHFETFLNGHPTILEEVTVEHLRDVVDYKCSGLMLWN